MERTDKQLSLYAISFAQSLTPTRAECRVLVEQILQEHHRLDKKPQLTFNSYGRPSAKGCGQTAFSYSHSQSQLVVALHHSVESVGVDTEPAERINDLRELEEAAFSPAERNSLSDSDYVVAWCTKEAAVKRLGTGFHDADPAKITIKTSGQSYKLYLDDQEIQHGHFFSITLGDDLIAVCADEPTKDLVLHRRTLKDVQIGE